MGKTQGDFVDNALGSTETTETNLGDITIPAGPSKKIVGLWGIATIQTATAAEGTTAYFKLAFKRLGGVFKFPAQVFQGPAGTLANLGPAQSPRIIPVDIDVEPNETITPYMALALAQTGSCRGQVGIIYE